MSIFSVMIDGKVHQVDLDGCSDQEKKIYARIDGQDVQVIIPNSSTPIEGIGWLIINDQPIELIYNNNFDWLKDGSGNHQVEIRDLEALEPFAPCGDGRLISPIPGQIIKVNVTVGQKVCAGETLFVLEAMKMENEIRAPRSGVVRVINASSGLSVPRGYLLGEID